jgi:hypothetical protein
MFEKKIIVENGKTILKLIPKQPVIETPIEENKEGEAEQEASPFLNKMAVFKSLTYEPIEEDPLDTIIVIVDAEIPTLDIKPKNEAIIEAEKREGVPHGREAVWVDGAENTPGTIILPYDDYSHIYVAEGTYEEPVVRFIEEYYEGCELPYYYKDNGKTYIKVAHFSGGGGIQSDPYLVETIEDLNNVRNNMSAWYRQVYDINASITSAWDNGAGFVPIGNQTTPFKGKYDGNNKKISNLFINRPTLDDVSLFGVIDYTGRVFDLNIENPNFTGNNRVGGLVGLIGNSSTNGAAIYGCSVAGTTPLKGATNIGGFCGVARRCEIQYCSSNIGIDKRSDYASDSYSNGGFVGAAYGAAVIKDCYAFGTVKGNKETGGFVGLISEGCKVVRCYTASPVISITTLAESTMGGFWGRNTVATQSSFNSCYWDIERTTRNIVGYSTGTPTNTPVGKTTTEMKTPATYVGWDTKLVWVITSGNYPYLQKVNAILLGSGTIQDPYQIWDVNDLYNIRLYNGVLNNIKYFKLMTNIDATDTKNWNNGQGFIPIGVAEDPAYISIDGGNFTISNLFIKSEGNYTGLIGYCASNNTSSPINVINNIKFDKAFITGTTYTAVAVGYINGNITGYVSRFSRTIQSVRVKNSLVVGTSYVGGIVGGYNGPITIQNCGFIGTIKGITGLGGIVSIASDSVGSSNSSITYCYTKGIIEGLEVSTGAGYRFGGIAAGIYVSATGSTNITMNLSYCYSHMEIRNTSENDLVGGICSLVSGYSQYAGWGTVNCKNNYFAGKIAIQGIKTNPSVSELSRNGSPTTDISGNYYDKEVLGFILDTMGGINKTTTEMKTQSTFTGWDFVNTWKMEGYPAYKWEITEIDYWNPSTDPTGGTGTTPPGGGTDPGPGQGPGGVIIVGYFYIATESGILRIGFAETTDSKLINNKLRICTENGIKAIILQDIDSANSNDSKYRIRLCTEDGIKAIFIPVQ